MDLDSEKYDDPFQEAEEHLSIKIPENLKRIFMANGFNDTFTLSTLDEDAFTDTETFAKNDLPELIDHDEFEKYFGIFKNNIQKFRILEGFKRKLLAISNYYKNKLENKKKEDCKNLRPLKTPFNRLKNHSIQKLYDSKRIKLVADNSERNTLIIDDSGDDSLFATETTSSTCFKYDLTKEKNSVHLTLKCWLNEYFKNSQVSYLHEQNISSESLDITITVNNVSVGSNEEHQYGELIAHIACVLCKNRIKIKKLSKNCNSPSRWIYSNYHRHIKTHEKNNKVCKLNKFGKQVQPQLSTLKDYFIPSTSTSTITSIPATGPASTLSSSDTLSNNNSMIENTVTEELDFDYCSGNSGGDTICKTPEIPPNALKSQKTKWQNKNYSKTERYRRALHNSLLSYHLNQPLITNFYPIINKIEKIIIEN